MSTPRPLRVAIDARVVCDRFTGIGRYVYHLAEALAGEAGEAGVAGVRRSSVRGGRATHRVAPTHSDGAWPESEGAEGGLELVLVHTPGQTDRRFDLAELARRPAVSLLPVAAPVFTPAAQWRVPRALRPAGVDLWHATYWAGPYRTGLPTVLTLYDRIGAQVPEGMPIWKRAALAAMLRLAVGGAGQVLTLSEASRRRIVEGMGLAAERVTVTPLAADVRFRPQAPEAVAALRARLGLPERYVLYLGINKPHKNLALLIDAWGRLAADRPELAAASALVIAGPWDARFDDLRARAAALPAAAVPRFLGPVAEADLPGLYAGAAVFAFPSREEGFGLPPLEAMACGTPVIAARASSLPEVVGDAGLLLDPDQPGAWAEALAGLLADPAARAALARSGLARAARFSWAETARRTLAVYRALAARPRA